MGPLPSAVDSSTAEDLWTAMAGMMGRLSSSPSPSSHGMCVSQIRWDCPCSSAGPEVAFEASAKRLAADQVVHIADEIGIATRDRVKERTCLLNRQLYSAGIFNASRSKCMYNTSRRSSSNSQR